MDTNDLNYLLYEKMSDEQDIFRDWLKSLPREEMLYHAYEYSVREDIVMATENMELTDAQAKALLDSPSPLADIYRNFQKLETDHMDVIRDCIENRANDICEENEQKTGSVLVVEPGKKPYSKEISFSLESLQQQVGGYIQAVYPFKEPVALICNEEGKLEGHPLNRALKDDEGNIYDIVAGTFLIVGLGAEDFAPLTPELSAHFADFFKTPELFIKINGKLAVILAEDANAEPPLYLHSAAYAAEHSEKAVFLASNHANIACKEAIEEAIRSHYNGSHLDTQEALKEILQKFSPERVQFILASTAIHKDWDARISPENKSWARTIPMPQEADSGRMAAYVIDQVHPGLTNLLINQARTTLSTPEKSSVLQKLKQEPVPRSSAPTKKHEPER